jgi:hypothetical protein
MKRLLSTFVSLLALSGAIAHADTIRPTYREMISSFGFVTGVFAQVVAIQEHCPKKFPEMSSEFLSNFNNYKRRHEALDIANRNLNMRAREEGGDAEVRRLQSEITVRVDAITRSRAVPFAKSLSKKQCRMYLSKMGKGQLDLWYVYPQKMKNILER